MSHINSRFFLVLAVYIAFAAGLIFVQKPNDDEAAFANVSINLIEHGYMGITVAESIFNWQYFDTYFFWHPPLSILIRSAWFKVFGIGLFQMRFLGLLFGIIGLVAWYIILRKLGFKEKVIFFILLLMAFDYNYNRYSVDGRLLDIMSCVFAFTGWALYLFLREKRFTLALFLSNSFVMFSGMSHVNGIVGFFGLCILILSFDRAKLALKHIPVSLLPYLIGLSGWGIYILQNPSAFVSQFLGNVSVIKNPFLLMVYSEIVNRYLFTFGFASTVPGIARLLVFILILYFGSYIYVAVKSFTSKDRTTRIVFALTTAIMIYLMLLPHKFPYHVCWVVPLFAVCTGILYDRIEKNKYSRIFIAYVVFCVLIASGVNAYRFKKNEYRKYKNDADEIKKLVGNAKPVIGRIDLAFELGFDRIYDDLGFGYKSGKKADFIIVDEITKQIMIDTSLTDSGEGRYVKELLSHFSLAYKGRIYEVYSRKTSKT